jgi:hypothetical protein
VKKTPSARWRHVLRVAPTDRHTLINLLLQEKDRIAGYYDAAVEQHFHESCRPSRLEIVKVVPCRGGIAVVIASRDCRPNVLTEAILNVLPRDMPVQLPTWA